MATFASVDIHLPDHYKEYFHTYCLTRAEGTRNNPEDSPFPRMVDMWFFSICLAAHEGLTPDFNSSSKKYKAINGDALLSDSWRCNALMLLAISHTKDIEIADNPPEIIKIANAYANVGLPRLISLLKSKGNDDALDYLSDLVVDMI